MYIFVHKYFSNKIRLKYSQVEDVDQVEDIKHDRARACLELLSIPAGVEIASMADVPAGTGLGSSSSFTVGLLVALAAFHGQTLGPKNAASMACSVEIDKLKYPIGKQDQYCAACGGLNYIRFNADESVQTEPIRLDENASAQMQECLMLFYTGTTRLASGILAQQQANMLQAEKYDSVRRMVALADQLKQALASGHVSRLGSLLHENWLLKRELADNISTSTIDDLYQAALDSGAVGGKLLGAGNSGFILLYVPPENQDNVRRTLNLRELPFTMDPTGVKVLCNDGNSR
jgi:D-glycero-alpha-D-manno-heptose-7-phosphate kinase